MGIPGAEGINEAGGEQVLSKIEYVILIYLLGTYWAGLYKNLSDSTFFVLSYCEFLFAE